MKKCDESLDKKLETKLDKKIGIKNKKWTINWIKNVFKN